MTKDQVKEDRVFTWPQERREDAAQLLLALEAHEDYSSGDELAAIEEGFAKHGETMEIS